MVLVCCVGLLLGLKKNGIPKTIFSLNIFLLFGLLMFSWCSYLWTPAPKSALSVLVHFTLEAPLVFLLPVFTIGKVRDYRIIALVAVAFAVLISLVIILAPVSGISGRCLLIADGTVLSPASAILTAVIFFLFTNGYESGKINTIISFCILITMLLGLFLLGARTQFFLATIVFLYSSMLMKDKYQKMVIAGILSVFLIVTFFIFFVGGVGSNGSSGGEVQVNIERRSKRFLSDDIVRGLSQRTEMVKLCLDSQSPLIGNGIMSWGYSIFGKDENHYPHNSLAQLYYELGLIGLFLFISFNYQGIRSGLSFYKVSRNDIFLKRIGLMLLCYWLCAFTLSLKQSTFMAVLGIYCSIGMMQNAETRFCNENK